MTAFLENYEFTCFGGPCLIAFYVEHGAELEADEHVAELQNFLRAFQTKYSRFDSRSFVSELAKKAGTGERSTVDEQTFALLTLCDELYTATNGLFDASSGVLQTAWNFASKKTPDPYDLERLLELVDWKAVEWDSNSIYLPRSGMSLDFGGIGKEYACDLAASHLLAQGYRYGYINFGGDLRILGPHLDGQAWRCGIRHPDSANRAIDVVELVGGCLATSGDYERGFTKNGRRYSHLLNPRTGYGVQTPFRSISILAESTTLAGAHATMGMLLTSSDAKEPDFKLADLPSPVLAVDHNMKITRSNFHPVGC